MKHKMICLLAALMSAALILASCGGQSGEKSAAAAVGDYWHNIDCNISYHMVDTG